MLLGRVPQYLSRTKGYRAERAINVVRLKRVMIGEPSTTNLAFEVGFDQVKPDIV
jgi:hypothetical protein